MGLQGEIYDGWNKRSFFGRLVGTYGAAFATRWRLKANHSRRASGDLARLAKIEHLSAFHKVLGTQYSRSYFSPPNERIIASFASRKSRSSYPYKL
jgi:hypothetical protein